ncbi:hypothetical protein EDF24_0699 [Curtobacterium sp. PhB130]|uniref:hypothetical protein n=1 Tax=Curtobacterium sp. PhB130 TaxID=2485178 RepID=UPI000F4CE3CE|nr:hypothetical protein [Curtobacterium sp. PhB130]ROS77931.1 hypothetical protein EDF24_0699 [Curtobacterium sp. PhB130]
MTKSRIASTTAAAAALALTVVGLSGCAQVHQQVGDAWSVTYEVSVDAPESVTLHDVRFQGAERRGAAPTTNERSAVSTTSDTKSAAQTWTHESIVLTDDPASVRATPPAERTASCRILLDGKKVIAEEHGRAGAPVRCAATTPDFD